MAQPIPEGFSPITPHLVCRNCAEAIEWYQKAFGAEDLGRMMMPDSQKIMHAMIRINGAPVMLVDEMLDWGSKSPQALEGSPVTIHLYVEDVDVVYNKAVEQGANPVMPVMDAFWGDRYGKLIDPYGHHWSIATHTRDLSPEEMEEAAKAAFASMPNE